jgi:predicted ATPase/DNA-binding CsgD family transcriptional regulator
VGKTRLALQVAEDLLEEYDGVEDGVYVVDLAPISDARLVIPTVGRTLQLREAAGSSLIDTVSEYLRDRQVLLVLDNFEQVAAAGQDISELLAACATLKVLVTSRSVLQLRTEQVLQVPPLDVAPREQVLDFRALSRYSAIALFNQRASRANAGFEFNEGNAEAVAEICRLLEGIPLAIELVAERTALLPPRSILSRLGHPLRLLTGGAQDAPARHQTMRRAIEWSYNLLSEREQRAFKDMSVFVGGCTLEAAEAILRMRNDEQAIPHSELIIPHSDDPLAIEVLDVVLSLVNSSLLRRIEQGENDPRVSMLETVREFARDQLESSGEAETMLSRHLNYYLALAERAGTELTGPDQQVWLRGLEADHDNLRAALRWAIAQQDAEPALRMCAALATFWRIHGHLAEGRRWFGQALELQAGTSVLLRAKALGGSGVLAYAQGDYPAAQAKFEQGLHLAEEAGDKPLMARALGNLGNLALIDGDEERELALYGRTAALFREMGDVRNTALVLVNMAIMHTLRAHVEQAAPLAEESLALFREAGDRTGTTWALSLLSDLAAHRGDYEQARAIAHEALAISRELGDKTQITRILGGLGEFALREGNLEQAGAVLQECLALCRETGDKQRLSRALNLMGLTVALQGDRERATELCRESVVVARELGDKIDIAACISGWAQALLAMGGARDTESNSRAAQLLSLADALGTPSGNRWELMRRTQFNEAVAAARLALGDKAFSSAWKKGHALSIDEAIGIAVEPLPIAPRSASPQTRPPTKRDAQEKPGGLTTREREVAILVAQGLSNKAIGGQLVVSERTIEMHVANALHKLGLASRAQLAAWAVRQSLHDM